MVYVNELFMQSVCNMLCEECDDEDCTAGDPKNPECKMHEAYYLKCKSAAEEAETLLYETLKATLKSAASR